MFFQALIFCNINKLFQLSLKSIRIQFIVLIYFWTYILNRLKHSIENWMWRTCACALSNLMVNKKLMQLHLAPLFVRLRDKKIQAMPLINLWEYCPSKGFYIFQVTSHEDKVSKRIPTPLYSIHVWSVLFRQDLDQNLFHFYLAGVSY